MTKYNEFGPSSRVRFLAYLEYFKDAHLNFKLSYFFYDKYIEDLYYLKKKSLSGLIMSYLKRIKLLFFSKSADALWIEGELFPWLPYFFEKFFIKVPYILDYDDAIYARYQNSNISCIRFLLKDKIKKLMKNAMYVVVANKTLEKYAINSGATSITNIPSCIDTKRYPTSYKKNIDNKKKCTIGWIGTPNTIKYLENIFPILKETLACTNANLVVIGATSTLLEEITDTFLPWKFDTEVQNIQDFDIGIMPLNDGLHEQGKSGYKIIQYMGCFKPVVVSPIGTNNDIVSHTIDGFIAKNHQEWVKYLIMLINDKNLREKMGKKGREKVEKFFSIHNYANIYQTILTTSYKS